MKVSEDLTVHVSPRILPQNLLETIEKSHSFKMILLTERICPKSINNVANSGIFWKISAKISNKSICVA
jgi:hypothetical protein